MGNILSFPEEHFNKQRQRPLTQLMISTLIEACNKQKQGIMFGPQDIKGSISSLISRGLIANKLVPYKSKMIPTWYVTQPAIDMLKKLGIKILC